MDGLDAWFPYDSYRPYQREMLELGANCAEIGGVAMIDAPTGSGKSSVVSALLARAGGRKVVVAVRTISQLGTFLRELELVRRKQPGLTFAYLVGKRQMCPMAGESDPYRLCDALKALSTSLARDRAGAGSLVPVKDPVIKRQMARNSPEHPVICPYFLHSRVYAGTGEGLKLMPSATLRNRGAQAARKAVMPERLRDYAGELCPYELMMQAAREADVILLNFYHLFDREIREQLYAGLDLDSEQVLLLIDEAHNCGDTVQSIQSVVLEERTLESAKAELAGFRTRMKSVEAVLRLIPQVERFAESLKKSWKEEDWFDPAVFTRFVLTGSLYRSFEEVVDDLLRVSDIVREQRLAAGDYAECAIERLTTFFYRITRAGEDGAYLTVYRIRDGSVSLEVRNIDPAETLQEIVTEHAACVMISGTLSPVQIFARYYFGELPVQTITLPNAFPRENRLLLCATDITTAYSRRSDEENSARIRRYIETFAGLPGNLAVYLPSYELLRTYTEVLPPVLGGKEVFVEPPASREAAAALARFVTLPATGKSGIIFGVCGGKWSEGLDYRGEMLSGAMVVGLPLAPFNPVRKMTIDYFQQKFGSEGEFISYTLPALNRALQALGRVLRTPDDRGVLVLAEGRYLEPRVRSGLPGWMQEELRPCDLAGFSQEVEAWR